MQHSKKVLIAIILLLMILSLTNANNTASYLNNGLFFITLYAEGYNQLENAAIHLKTGISEGRDVPDSLLLLGLIHQTQGQYQQALKAYNQLAIELPDEGWIYVLIGDMEQILGNQENALASYEKALTVDQYAKAHSGLARILASQNQSSMAIAAYEKSLEIATDFVSARIELAKLYYTKSKWDEALENFELANRYDPYIAEVHYYMGLLYYNDGDHPKAIHALERALQLDPSYSLAQQKLEGLTL